MMNAEVIAIGPFSRAIIPHLQYPADRYADTRDGITVVETVFFAETTSGSVALAECFHVDPWDFNQHELDPARADLARLQQITSADEVARFLALRTAQFRFFYRPNG
jgi:hypothetical protein